MPAAYLFLSYLEYPSIHKITLAYWAFLFDFLKGFKQMHILLRQIGKILFGQTVNIFGQFSRKNQSHIFWRIKRFHVFYKILLFEGINGFFASAKIPTQWLVPKLQPFIKIPDKTGWVVADHPQLLHYHSFFPFNFFRRQKRFFNH